MEPLSREEHIESMRRRYKAEEDFQHSQPLSEEGKKQASERSARIEKIFGQANKND